MTLTPDTRIEITLPDAPENAGVVTTWADFIANNDEDTVEDVLAQLEGGHHYAAIGGGASPVFWVFA